MISFFFFEKEPAIFPPAGVQRSDLFESLINVCRVRSEGRDQSFMSSPRDSPAMAPELLTVIVASGESCTCLVLFTVRKHVFLLTCQ